MSKIAETIKDDISLLDPFMGASNTLVTGMKCGMNVFGQDINPLSLLLSQVKTTFYSAESLLTAEKRILETTEQDKNIDIPIRFPGLNKWFIPSVQIELGKLHRAISAEKELKVRKFFWVVLAEVIRLTSNDRTSTFKLHVRPDEEIRSRKASALICFKTISKRNISSITSYISVLENNKLIKSGKYIKSVEVRWADTSESIKTRKKFNLLVTSPPYGDNQTTVTYGQFSYLPLQWIPISDIDTAISFDYLKSTQEIDSQSLGGLKKKDIEEIEEVVFKKSKTLKKFVAQFKDVERLRAQKVTRFIYDLDRSIDNMLVKLRDNCYMVWTIGNRNVNKTVVPNDVILTELMKSKGATLFTDLDREILSKRMPGRNNISNTMSKEKILIYKK
ncbi:MAG: hypothetical protein EOO43_17175 [Flavobacterium sp.]|nr:MAG: hypothetical protein EOO43_17175 [Flavobacterium sp.]